MSMGEAVAILAKPLCSCGSSGKRGKLQSPASSKRTSSLGWWLATSSWGLRCQRLERPALGSFLPRPKCGDDGCSTGVLMGVLAAVDSRGEWERGGGCS